MILLAYLLAASAVYLTAYVLYHAVLFIGNALIADDAAFEPSRVRKFNVIVPAHNEELYLPRLLASLCAQAYPREHRQITVVADNCTDGTPASARGFDVDVLERTDSARRGKGYAIRWALERIDLNRFDAVVIVDGDSLVDSDFLTQLNLQMERGDRVIQCYNGVANPGQSWFTRLMHVSRTMANDIVHPGKRKLGLSSYLMGNGMCFDAQTLKTYQWQAFSVAEDWEYYARLVLNGMDVGYSRLARVYHQESANLRQASFQRMRWSGGRFQVLRRYGGLLLLESIRMRSLKCLDASLPLVFPNPSLGINLTFIGTAGAALLWWLGGGPVLLTVYSSLVAIQLSMFAIAVFYTKDRAASATSLALAPVFLAWKMGIDVLSICGIGAKEWKRTERRPS